MMMHLYNTFTRRIEPFEPRDPSRVSMYVCGPTVYDEPHLGHLRSAYVFEVIRNYLEFLRNRVRFIRNVTDVDDKIIEKARENKPVDLLQEVKIVSEKYYQSYAEALKALGVRAPDKEPRATTHVSEMIALIKKLL